MRKIASLFLVFLIAANSFGLLIFYWGEMQLCQVLSENLSTTEIYQAQSLIAFSADEKDFHLINGREILRDGKLFDIVKKEIQNGKLIYYAVSDEKEDGCVQNISRLTNNNSNGNSMPGKITAPEILKYTRSRNVSDLQSILPVQPFSCIIPMSDLLFYQSPLGDIFSPPPNVSVS